MSFPHKLRLRNGDWDLWLDRFPNLPLPSKFDLQWTLNRLKQAKASLPDPKLLAARERQALIGWIEDYEQQFDTDQQRPKDGPDVPGWLGLLSGIAGLPMLKIAPPIGIGLLTLTFGALGTKESRRRKLNLCDQFKTQIKAVLYEIRRYLR
jgi:hypothetical protein